MQAIPNPLAPSISTAKPAHILHGVLIQKEKNRPAPHVANEAHEAMQEAVANVEQPAPKAHKVPEATEGQQGQLELLATLEPQALAAAQPDQLGQPASPHTISPSAKASQALKANGSPALKVQLERRVPLAQQVL